MHPRIDLRRILLRSIVAARTYIPAYPAITAPPPTRKISRRRKSWLKSSSNSMEYLASSPSFATFRDDSLSPLVLETRKVESEMDSDRPNFPRICHYSFSRKYKVFDRRQVVGTLTIGQWLFARTWAASWPSRDYEFVASGIDANRMKKKKKEGKKRGEKAFERARPIFL